jgi:hypothetical protein
VSTANTTPSPRDVVFISKGTPEDDNFVVWLAPRLEAQGYRVFADILSLDGGDRWRKELTATLQQRAIKMLLCCRDLTLAKTGVQEEIGIAEDLAKELGDPAFIIPLRLERFRKLFGIGELQYIRFDTGWAEGLRRLLELLDKKRVPRDPSRIQISPAWEDYKRRQAISVEDAPERLTSNWLRILQVPDTIRYFQPTGAINLQAFLQEASAMSFPVEPYQRGLFGFCSVEDANTGLERVTRVEATREIALGEFLKSGDTALSIRSREATNIALSIFRKAWERYAKAKGLLQYFYSEQCGFHVTASQIPIGKKLRWGRQGDRRSSMLRNTSQGKVWQYGATAQPALWPFPHFKMKSRVLFAELSDGEAGEVFADKKLQHRFRRRICKGWRNKQWHGRLMAFLELMAEDQAYLKLPLGTDLFLRLEASPILFTSPITTILPNLVGDDDEEGDDATLYGPPPEDDE